MNIPILSSLIFLPLAGMILIMLIPKNQKSLIRGAATAITGLEFLLSLQLVLKFDQTIPGIQFIEHVSWIPQLNVFYHLGIDGISLTMIFATGLLSFLACIASFGIEERVKEYLDRKSTRLNSSH